jgi:hypothetical protein
MGKLELPRSLTETRLDDIHGLKPFIIFAPNWKLILLVVAAIVAFGFLLRWWLKRPRKPAAAAPVTQAAAPQRALSVREQLDHLRESRMIENGRVRDFHGTLSAILRGFLGTRFDLPGRRLTSTEILAGLEARAIDRGTYQAIADLLTGCDLAKFAKATPTRAEMEVRLHAAFQLVESLGDASTALEEADDAYPEPDRAPAGP